MQDRPTHRDASHSLRATEASGVFDAVPALAGDITLRPDRGETCTGFLQRLAAGATPEDALAFAAQCLNPRHSVWWGHECLQARPDLLTPLDRSMLALAAAWVATCDEESRYGALEAAARAERHPGTWIALGAGWSGGSMVPPELPPVPPPVHVTGRAVMTGVLLMLARVELAQRRRWLGHFVGMAQSLSREA